MDRVLGGVLFQQFGSRPTGTSYRDHTRRLTRPDPALYTGMDLLLGSPGDQPITVWGEMFLPMTVRDALREVTVDDGAGGTRPLVISEEVLAEARVAREPDQAPTWWPWYLLAGLLGGAAFAGLGVRASRGSARARWGLAVLGGIWGGVTGLAGTILVAVLFTDHHFMVRNENLFLLSPLSLLLAVLVPLAVVRPSVRSWTTRAALAVCVLACVGVVVNVLPVAVQRNGIHAAFLLPMHLGLWWATGALASGRGGGSPS